jgi:hypothetical protein
MQFIAMGPLAAPDFPTIINMNAGEELWKW